MDSGRKRVIRESVKTIRYEKGFFDLQLHFAQHVAQLAEIALPEALLRYTNFYIRFGLGGVPDDTHPGWQAYVAGLVTADDPGQWSYTFYLDRAATRGAPPVEASVGCFSYALLSGEKIRLHFHNAETTDHSPLASDRVAQRQQELARLFVAVQQQCSDETMVVGASWLYNLPAYRRLFPPAYTATAQIVTGRFQRMPLWGQFVDRRGAVKAAMRATFLARLAQQTSLDRLDDCFPLQVLTVTAPVRTFCEFYRV